MKKDIKNKYILVVVLYKIELYIYINLIKKMNSNILYGWYSFTQQTNNRISYIYINKNNEYVSVTEVKNSDIPSNFSDAIFKGVVTTFVKKYNHGI